MFTDPNNIGVEENIDIQQLLKLINANDAESKVLLYDKYCNALYGMICRMVTSQQMREHLLEQVFITIFGNLYQYNPKVCSFFTWISNITRKTCLDYRNQFPEQQNFSNEEISIPPVGLTKLIAGLSFPYRNILELSYFEGMSKDQISERLSIPVNEVPDLMNEALVRLRKLLK